MDEALSRKCDAHLKSLLKRSQAIHFAKPVDWKKMGLHDYPRLIKQPMDLRTISERLARGEYNSAGHAALAADGAALRPSPRSAASIASWSPDISSTLAALRCRAPAPIDWRVCSTS